MTQQNTISEQKIIELYMQEVLTGNTPSTVYQFAKKFDFEESDFYQYYSNFEVLEKEIFAVFCSETIKLLLQNKEYQTYDAKSKLLSFYFTFFELLTANRSYVVAKLKDNKNKLESLRLLSKLKDAFLTFTAQEIHTDSMDLKNKTLNKIKDKGEKEIAWVQLLFTLQFWLEDESKNFEKTDIFIEKSVKASFDLKNTTPIQSVFDFAKFLWNEKKPI